MIGDGRPKLPEPRSLLQPLRQAFGLAPVTKSVWMLVYAIAPRRSARGDFASLLVTGVRHAARYRPVGQKGLRPPGWAQ
jgi:hypothetical protein